MELTWNLWLGGWNHEKSILLSFIYTVLTSSLSDFELVSCTEMNIILIRCFCRVPFWVQRLGDILWTINMRSLRDPKTLGYPADHEVHPQPWHRRSKERQFQLLSPVRCSETSWAGSEVLTSQWVFLVGECGGEILPHLVLVWLFKAQLRGAVCKEVRHLDRSGSWSHGVMAQMFLLRSRFFWGRFFPIDARLPRSGSSIGRPAAQLAVKKHVRNHAVYQRWQAGQSWHVSSSKHQGIHTGKG